MSNVSTIFPITVVAAIGIFLLKEILEWRRREAANKRKVSAIKRLIADDMERNKWTLGSLRRLLSDLSTVIPAGGRTYLTSEAGYPRVHIERLNPDGELERSSSSRIPHVHRSACEKYVMDAATVDVALFSEILETLDSLAELENIRSQAINLIEGRVEEIGPENFIAGLADYAGDEIPDIEAQLGKLYRLCTGKDLAEHRVR